MQSEVFSQGLLGLVSVATFALALTGATPALAHGPMPGASPVDVQSCRISDGRRTFLIIDFTNVKALTADQVHFAVSYGWQHFEIKDHGRFSKDSVVTHEFSVPYDSSVASSDATCRVTYVHFLDGSTWVPHT